MSCKANINLIVCEGASYSKTFCWKTGDPAVGVNLTDHTITMYVRTGISSKSTVLELTEDNGKIIKSDQITNAGQFSLSLPSTDTQNLCRGGRDITYKYDILLESTGNTKKILIHGNLTVSPTVTRIWEV